jgi:polygalacturonase
MISMLKGRLLFVMVWLAWAGTLPVAAQYNILDYGAVNDTAQLSTTAINNAITTCFSRGGGRVTVPAGKFKSGTIVLKDNVELYLESGAFLYASTHKADFPRQAQPSYRSQKDPGGWFALIYAEGASHISISGKGTIDGQGAQQLPQTSQAGGDLDGRPRNILFISCNNVSVEGITMLNAGIWNQHYLNCEDVLVNNIRAYNHCNRNNDGIDIDGCRRFILTNSIIDSDDDAIVLKSTGKAGCEDVVVSNCIASSFTNAIKCGTESTGGFKNINIGNCVVKRSISKLPPVFGRTNIGITGISLEIVDGGSMDGVQVHDIVIEETECPIYVRLGNRARKYAPDALAPPMGTMRNISLSRITAYNTGNYCASITGVPGGSIENITLDQIRMVNKGGVLKGDYISSAAKVSEDEKGYPEPTVWKNLPSYGFFIRHVKRISLSGISLGSATPDPRPPVIGIDINRLTIRQLSIDQNEKMIELPLQLVKKVDTEKNIQVVTLQ